jgi:curli production assembly/transport component CsgG
MKKLAVFLPLLLAGCATWNTPVPTIDGDPPKLVGVRFTELRDLPIPTKKPVVAVYDFPDLTGQRKDSNAMSSLSTAVTQGSTALLIDALKNAGNGSWFTVVERNRVDDLAKERQIVRQTREEYLGDDSSKLKPMLFAGIILQGGIIGYDTNVVTGGAGARYLGIGADTQYRKDQVTVALRAVSTETGEVIMNVQVSKTILSVGSSLSVFKFIDVGTKLIEGEAGMTENEANTMAVKIAIEAAVVELIKQGLERGYWSYK